MSETTDIDKFIIELASNPNGIIRKYGTEACVVFLSLLKLYQTESNNIEKKAEIIGKLRKIYENFQIRENQAVEEIKALLNAL
jgi:hypothetical protein